MISNRRVMRVRARLRVCGSGRGGGYSGGGLRSKGVNGVRSQVRGGRGGGWGGLQGSAITCVELEWQATLDALTGLPALPKEDEARITLIFTHVAGPAYLTNSSRRGEDISGLRNNVGIAGLVAELGGEDGAGATAPSNSNTVGERASNVMGFNSDCIGGSIGRSEGSGGRVLHTRGAECLYRYRPALIPTYNAVACLMHRLGCVFLTPGGVNVSGSKMSSRSHFPTVGVERDPQIAIGERDRVRLGFLGVVPVKEWEFDADWRERLSLPGATHYSFDGSGAGLMRGLSFPGFGSSREAKESRALGLSSEQPTPARRSKWFAVRGDVTTFTDLWAPRWLLMRQRNLGLADEMRPVPHAFEMDAVVRNPGPFPPGTNPGSGWVLAIRSSALRVPNDLIRYARDSSTLFSEALFSDA